MPLALALRLSGSCLGPAHVHSPSATSSTESALKPSMLLRYYYCDTTAMLVWDHWHTTAILQDKVEQLEASVMEIIAEEREERALRKAEMETQKVAMPPAEQFWCSVLRA